MTPGADFTRGEVRVAITHATNQIRGRQVRGQRRLLVQEGEDVAHRHSRGDPGLGGSKHQSGDLRVENLAALSEEIRGRGETSVLRLFRGA